MREQLIKIIEDIGADIDLNSPDLNIAEDMESIDIITLIGEIEEAFSVEISMEDKTEENFKNVDTLIAMIKKLQ